MVFSKKKLLYSLPFVLVGVMIIRCDNDPQPEVQVEVYKNLSSDATYVGMDKCRQCHYDKYETFTHTGMGRSFGIADTSKTAATFGEHQIIYDEHTDLYYHPRLKQGQLEVLEFRLQGKDTVHQRLESIEYIVGSGQHTNSHILSRNGYLFQAALTYYTQKGKWDLPPGFEDGFNSRFSRKIGLECMSCHNALPDFVLGSENKFTHVPNGIDCERCHGPGSIHVKEKEAGILVDTANHIDYSIVNPAKLSADLQFDLCMRCHLQGNAVLKDGKSFLDFKPGMKLSDVMTVFLPKYANDEESFIMASHADRLKQSQCFLQTHSNDKKNGLTCINCHNPHVSVKQTGHEVFNAACRSCHSEPLSKATHNTANLNCVKCHMPKSGSIDIPHVSITDHYIRKPILKQKKDSLKTFIGLIAVNDKSPDKLTKAIAYLQQYEKFERNRHYLDSAAQLLNRNNPDHFSALVHLQYIRQDYFSLAEMAQQLTLPGWFVNLKTGYDNRDAWCSYRLAEGLMNSAKSQQAEAFYRKAVELAPYHTEFKSKLAVCFLGNENFSEARSTYESLLKEVPAFAPGWCNLGFIYLQGGNTLKANECYDRALMLDPDYEQALLNKAGVLFFEDKKQEAKVFAKRLLKINPEHAQARAIMEAK